MNRDDENERASSPDPTASDQNAEASRPGTTDVQAYIGRQLRAVYDDVVNQPIPDRLLALMRQLEE